MIVTFGPCSPKRIEIAAPAAFGIIIGTRNGDTRRSPLVRSTAICSSVVFRPPTPVAKIVPNRSGVAVGVPACSNASAAAVIAISSTWSARRAPWG